MKKTFANVHQYAPHSKMLP